MRLSLRFLLFGVFPVLAVWAAELGRSNGSLDLLGCFGVACAFCLFLAPIWLVYANDCKVDLPERQRLDDPTSPIDQPPRREEKV